MDTSATLGVLTTDRALVIRGWNEWLASATGETEAGAVGRPVTDFVAGDRADFYRDLLTDVIESGTPRVLAPAFHHYLIECAPRQRSAHFDRMQQRVTVAPLRTAAEVVGVLITLEDVTDRLDSERALSEQLKHDAGAPATATLTSTLASGDWQLRREVVGRLKQRAAVDEVQHLLATLQRDHHDLNVLNSALRVVIAAGRTVVEPLAALLSNDEPNVRMHAALALGELRAAAAVPALVDTLNDDNENVRFHAIEALGRIGAPDAVDALAAVASSGNFFLAFAAIDALSKTDDSRVAPLLLSLLGDETLRPAAISTLASVGDEDSVPALCALLDDGNDARAIATTLAAIHRRYEDTLTAGSVIVAIARDAITDAGVRRLADAAQSTTDRAALALVLSWLGKRSLDALISLAGDKSVEPIVSEGIAAAGEGAVDAVMTLLQRDQPAVRAAAAHLLGQLGDRKSLPALIAALDDVDDSVVCAAAAAMATFGDRDTVAPLFGLLSHPGTTVRHAAVAAINSMGAGGTSAQVAAALQDPRPHVREGALRIAGYFGFPECHAAIRQSLSDASDDVRRAAIEQLAAIDDEHAAASLIDALGKETPRNRAAAAHALRLVRDRRAGAALIEALADPDAWVRYFAAAALGEHPATAGAAAALDDLARRDPATHVRIAAITALSAVDGSIAIGAAAQLLDDTDDDLAAAAMAALGAIPGRESSERLSEAARSPRPSLQIAAIRAMAKQPTLESVETLSWAARLADPPSLQHDAIASLCAVIAAPQRPMVRRAAVEALLELATDPNHRESVIGALGKLPEDVVPDVASGLSSARVIVRLVAIDALAAMRNPRASRELARALRDEDPSVRAAAVSAFGRLGTTAVARTIAAMRRSDTDAGVRHRAGQACDRHGWNVGAVPRP